MFFFLSFVRHRVEHDALLAQLTNLEIPTQLALCHHFVAVGPVVKERCRRAYFTGHKSRFPTASNQLVRMRSVREEEPGGANQ